MKCDGCTLCCKLLPVPWMDSPAGEYCKECEPDIGCRIYKNAPEKCLEFKCAYNQMKSVSINMRPDKCGVIFERLDDIIIGTIDPEIGLLSKDILGQMDAFINQGFSFILYKTGYKTFIYSSKYTDNEIREKISAELKRLNGST